VNAFTRALLFLAITACADGLTLAPAAFSARYRTPRRITEALVIAAVVGAATASVVAL
jgi:hypothetical protein